MRYTISLSALAALVTTGCATFQQQPPTAPCHAWQAAEAAWSATDTYVRQQLATQRAAACMPPEPPPPPLEQSNAPGEVPPRNPTAPPEPVPLPGWRPREE